MNKPAATESNPELNEGNEAQKNQEKITLEGWLLYLLLFMVIIGLPAASTIWILTAANGNYVP